jgi:hypothetical protein
MSEISLKQKLAFKFQNPLYVSMKTDMKNMELQYVQISNNNNLPEGEKSQKLQRIYSVMNNLIKVYQNTFSTFVDENGITQVDEDDDSLHSKDFLRFLGTYGGRGQMHYKQKTIRAKRRRTSKSKKQKKSKGRKTRKY